jgi:hypothetical protein
MTNGGLDDCGFIVVSVSMVDESSRTHRTPNATEFYGTLGISHDRGGRTDPNEETDQLCILVRVTPGRRVEGPSGDDDPTISPEGIQSSSILTILVMVNSL